MHESSAENVSIKVTHQTASRFNLKLVLGQISRSCIREETFTIIYEGSRPMQRESSHQIKKNDFTSRLELKKLKGREPRNIFLNSDKTLVRNCGCAK